MKSGSTYSGLIYTSGQKYKTTLKNEQNDIVYNF